MKSFAEAQLLKLVRQNAEQIEVAARAHHFCRFVQQLDFAGRVRNAAVFFVSGGSGENDVGQLRGLRQEHFMDDQQLQLAAPRAERAEMRERIGAHNIKGFELSGTAPLRPFAARSSRVRGKRRPPDLRSVSPPTCCPDTRTPAGDPATRPYPQRHANWRNRPAPYSAFCPEVWSQTRQVAE